MNEISVIIQKLAQENGNHVYIKREDLIPYSFGGNKVRKALKFLKNWKILTVIVL